MASISKPKPISFEFTRHHFDYLKNKGDFTYQINFSNQKPLVFTETIQFPKSPKGYQPDKESVDRLLQDTHLALGLSYYKIYCPKKIIIPYKLTQDQAKFWTTLYRKGLSEMLYRNNLPLSRVPKFPHDKKVKANPKRLQLKNQVLLGIGGGKDSIVAGELLKEHGEKITAFELATQQSSPIISKVISIMDVYGVTIDRQLDPQIFTRQPDSFNGHIPISAIIAFLGSLTAILTNHRYIAVANAASSNFGNLEYDGQTINHQWSKTLEFELMMQEYLRTNLSPDLLYWSPIRPFFELRVVKLLTKYPQYLSSFSSCNRNFVISKDRPKTLWCGTCAKCAFMFTLLAAHLPKQKLVDTFGQNLFENESLIPMFTDLLGFGDLKPFDCVGPFEETQAALVMASKTFKDSLVVKTFLPKIQNSETLVQEMMKTQLTPTVPARFNLLGIETVLIAGFAREGKTTKDFLQKHYPKIKITTTDQENGSNYLEVQKDVDLVIKTPGIPKKLITRPSTTATNLFLSRVENITIGITGSKGKSTTASLVYHILKTAKKPVRLLGNIGKPMLSELDTISPKEILVLELSSYQLDDIKQSVNIAVVTNLFPDHLPYHDGLSNYYNAKRNITTLQRPGDVFIYNHKFPLLRQWAKQTLSNPQPFVSTIPITEKNIPLIGKHNVDNIKAATTVAHLLNVKDSVIKKAVQSFESLPHRLQPLGQFKDIYFYDDAISTTPESTIMAIKSLRNIDTILLGGTDRGYDFKDLEKVIIKHKIKNVVLFPDTGNRMFVNNKDLNILRTTTMKAAVAFAYNNTAPGHICLLSTASPSFSLWKNYEDKGADFAKWVKELGK